MVMGMTSSDCAIVTGIFVLVSYKTRKGEADNDPNTVGKVVDGLFVVLPTVGDVVGTNVGKVVDGLIVVLPIGGDVVGDDVGAVVDGLFVVPPIVGNTVGNNVGKVIVGLLVIISRRVGDMVGTNKVGKVVVVIRAIVGDMVVGNKVRKVVDDGLFVKTSFTVGN